jgi:DNA-binding CsgD family transcriptional regulator
MNLSMTMSCRAERAPALSGRQAEREVIDRHLHDAKAGRGSVLLVEGGAGLGKSRLLDEAVACADVDGFVVGSAVASPLDHPIAMAPLLSALFDGAEPVLDGTVRADAFSQEPSFWSVSRLANELELAAHRQPLLLCIDDLHAVDRETAAALGILTQRLLGLPVLWILSLRPQVARRAVADLVALIERHGASRLTLEPLDETAVRNLTADLIGAEPSVALVEVAALAGGVPAIVVDLVRGLLEEGLATVEGGRADVVEGGIPRRIGDRVRAAIAGTSPRARDVATVAAVFGNPLAPVHLATMLEVAPASLLAPIEELVHADVLIDDGRSLGFRAELDRRALIELVAPSVSRALRLQAIEVLLDAGACPLPPARELAATVQPGDRTAVATLTAASHAVGAVDPALAAQLCRRALDVTVVGDQRRPALAADLATFLHDSGRAEEGKAIVDAVAGEPLAADDEAMVRLAAARMVDLAPQFRVEAGLAALAVPGVSAPWRAAHAAQLVLNHLDDGRLELAAAVLTETEAADEPAGGVAATPTFQARARLAAMGGDLERARADLEAASAVIGPGELFHAELLLALDDHEALQPLVTGAVDTAQRTGQVGCTRSWRRLRARLHLRRGELAQAHAVLAGDLHDDAEVTPDDARALLTMAELAIHTGDDRRTKELAGIAAHTFPIGGPAVRRLAAWLNARHAETSKDPAGVRLWLGSLGQELDVARLPMLTLEPTAAPQLVRMAQLAGLDGLAVAAATTMVDLACRNPTAPSITAAAAHCRGLVEHDPDALATAAEGFANTSMPLAHASALEDLGVELTRRPSAGSAVEAFDGALRRYAQCGAGWDASRVRRRLRQLGVRRRLVASSRPTHGWDGLTAAELAVVKHVADGLTNRAVARQLFLSSHTVSMHLRHVFVKLGINSRVELTRLAVDREIA